MSGGPQPMTGPPPAPGAAPNTRFKVDLPGGGDLEVDGQDEVDLWEENANRYLQEYGLVKQNDLVLLGAILSQVLLMYRAQRELIDPKLATKAQQRLITASEEIRKLEAALGIDKKTREAGGQHTVGNYVTMLKRAAHKKGIRIAERTKAYEAVIMEARWRVRLLRNGDDEDRAYHGVRTPSDIVDWLEAQMNVLEESDKTWAKQYGKVFVGRL